jgi:hypothetical protein
MEKNRSSEKEKSLSAWKRVLKWLGLRERQECQGQTTTTVRWHFDCGLLTFYLKNENAKSEDQAPEKEVTNPPREDT